MFTVAMIGGLVGTPMMPPPDIKLPIILVANEKRLNIHRGRGRRDEDYQQNLLKAKLSPMDHVCRS